mmetsp:Transcript_51586/g.102317  ORF Transcript_51586/g.102317 Transcript_51586/m.102317 type:complete len:203 (-) Transcript_51586:31-639(-)
MTHFRRFAFCGTRCVFAWCRPASSANFWRTAAAPQFSNKAAAATSTCTTPRWLPPTGRGGLRPCFPSAPRWTSLGAGCCAWTLTSRNRSQTAWPASNPCLAPRFRGRSGRWLPARPLRTTATPPATATSGLRQRPAAGLAAGLLLRGLRSKDSLAPSSSKQPLENKRRRRRSPACSNCWAAARKERKGQTKKRSPRPVSRTT